MRQNISAISPAELNALVGELLENREAVAELAMTHNKPGLLKLRDATIAAAQRMIEKPTLVRQIEFWSCLEREREVLRSVAGDGYH